MKATTIRTAITLAIGTVALGLAAGASVAADMNTVKSRTFIEGAQWSGREAPASSYAFTATVRARSFDVAANDVREPATITTTRAVVSPSYANAVEWIGREGGPRATVAPAKKSEHAAMMKQDRGERSRWNGHFGREGGPRATAIPAKPSNVAGPGPITRFGRA